MRCARFSKTWSRSERGVPPPIRTSSNESLIVLVTIVVVGAMIYGLDWLFSTFILELFDNN